MPRRERVRLAYLVVGSVACLVFALMGAVPVISYAAGLSFGAQLALALEPWARRTAPPRPAPPAPEPKLEVRGPWWAAR